MQIYWFCGVWETIYLYPHQAVISVGNNLLPTHFLPLFFIVFHSKNLCNCKGTTKIWNIQGFYWKIQIYLKIWLKMLKNRHQKRVRHRPTLKKHYASENWSLPTPQMGQTQSSGSSLNAFPVSLGSYSYPQTSQMYFAIVIKFYVNKLFSATKVQKIFDICKFWRFFSQKHKKRARLYPTLNVYTSE